MDQRADYKCAAALILVSIAEDGEMIENDLTEKVVIETRMYIGNKTTVLIRQPRLNVNTIGKFKNALEK